ncbi:MAG: FAD/NAD(P)-binding protein [Terriglobales bacterium]
MGTKQIQGNGNSSQFTIAVVGGGFTGALLAAQLLRKSHGAVSVILIEKSAQLALGVAYGTQCKEHLLNVRAKNMSAYPDDPEHFLRWARSNYDSSAQPDDYLPRLVYGQYAAFLLREEIELHPGQFERVEDEVVSVSSSISNDRAGDHAQINLRSGGTLTANRVVLALGHFPPGDLRFPGKPAQSQHYIANPWTNRLLGDLAPDKSILLIGSGLTSVDVVLSLRRQGFRGTIHIASRRGLLPLVHKAISTWPSFWDKNSPKTARGLLRLIRTQVKAAEKSGGDWRSVIDSLRPFTQDIWRSLPYAEQQRFLRHLRPYWDVHRHRIAPVIGATLAAEMKTGQIHMHAGRITEYSEDADGVDVTYRERKDGQPKRLRVHRVINCTGPEGDYRNVDHALLANLLRQKIVRPDPLLLGLDVASDGALIDADGVASDFLYTLGPIRKGGLWETIAVPEIRVQASELAALLLASNAQENTNQALGEMTVPEKGPMYFEQFFLSCLAHASYMLASGGEAVVVDPQRDVDIYLKAAEQHGVKIRHIFETHLHADFVSGHKELAARTGAKVYIGPNGGATLSHVEVRDGFDLRLGSVLIKVLETPGHTPESICLVVTDENKSTDPWAVLTGDALFIGDVGRPDLSKTHTPAVLAGMLYDSLRNKLLKLPDDVLVYPAHGAGSLCGKKMRAERSSTIGTERLTNYALQIQSKEEFIQQLTANLPPRPEYFPQDAQINRTGAPALSELPELTPISAEELKSLLDAGVIALDVRPGDDFASGHVPGSIGIPLSGEFASWAGIVLGLSSQPVLIAASEEQMKEARTRLARVGIDDARGYLRDGIVGWTKAGLPLAEIPQVNPRLLSELLRKDKTQVLDVRRKPEWEAGHIEGATWLALDDLKTSLPTMLPTIDRKAPIAVICKGGYRSLIASSLLQRAGFENVTNVTGGFVGWEKAKLPVVGELPIAV